MTNNQINYWRYKEDSRHNKVTEVETERHNRVAEAEIVRHNVVSEGEVYRHNVVTEGEIQRHNIESEALGRAQLDEVVRHNVRSEALETQRIQLGYAQVSLGYSQLQEARRSNIANEQIRGRANEITNAYNQGLLNLRGQEVAISNRAQQENVRHNQAMEYNSFLSATASQKQAEASILNAGANMQNADTNRRNSNTNLLNSIWSNANDSIDMIWSNLK